MRYVGKAALAGAATGFYSFEHIISRPPSSSSSSSTRTRRRARQRGQCHTISGARGARTKPHAGHLTR
jgi:hypothetical protein